MRHDSMVHDPLGGNSYVYKKEFIPALLQYAGLSGAIKRVDSIDTSSSLPVKELVIHIGAQPNNSPHVGTLVTFALAFHIANRMRKLCNDRLNVSINLDLVETAPDSTTVVPNGYQKSLRATGHMHQFINDYRELLSLFSERSNNVPFKETYQTDLNASPVIGAVISEILANREEIARILAPETHRLALRVACPVCGKSDKHGLQNRYTDTTVDFFCVEHGYHAITLAKVEDLKKLEYNTPLRNLMRSLIWACEGGARHVRVTGRIMRGYFRNSFISRHLHEDAFPVTVYSPQIVDWAGSKVSKSLYVKEGAYNYLREQSVDYLLSYRRMKEMGKDVGVVFDEVGRWVDDPKRLFRQYSLEYMRNLFETV
ncbi:hypothetical protein BC829DRAFT_468334 [Chytridium lagenaria]|nr:hypothetical protein BC829DRAFT_468334 [Chytridium lagenaria]